MTGARQHNRNSGMVENPSHRWCPVRINCHGGSLKYRRSSVGSVAREENTAQVAAPIEGISPDAGDALGNSDIGQAGAVLKAIGWNVGDTAGNGDTGQVGTILETTLTDAADAFGDRHAGGDGQPADLGWNGQWANRSTRHGSAGDGKAHTVTVCRVFELGLHRSRYLQEQQAHQKRCGE